MFLRYFFACVLGAFSFSVLVNGKEYGGIIVLLAALSLISAVTLIFLNTWYMRTTAEVERYQEFREVVRFLFLGQREHLQQAIDAVLRKRSRSFHSACFKQAECLREYAQALAGTDGEKENLIETWDAAKREWDRLVAETKKGFWDQHSSLKRMVEFLALPVTIQFKESSKGYLDEEKPAVTAS